MSEYLYHVVVNMRKGIDAVDLEERLKSLFKEYFISAELFYGSLQSPQTANIHVVLGAEVETQELKERIIECFQEEFKSITAEIVFDWEGFKKRYQR